MTETILSYQLFPIAIQPVRICYADADNPVQPEVYVKRGPTLEDNSLLVANLKMIKQSVTFFNGPMKIICPLLELKILHLLFPQSIFHSENRTSLSRRYLIYAIVVLVQFYEVLKKRAPTLGKNFLLAQKFSQMHQSVTFFNGMIILPIQRLSPGLNKMPRWVQQTRLNATVI